MKYLLITIIYFSIFNDTKAQAKNYTDSLFSIAFQKFAIELDSFYLKYGNNSSSFETIFVEKNDYIDHIPTKIGNRKVVFLTAKNSFKIYKKNKNSIRHLKVFPMKLAGDTIEITFTPYYGKYKNRRTLSLALSDWTKIYFKFDCNSRTWKYLKSENGGI